MIILGLNAYHGDSSACILVDGQLDAAVEEERFRRIKHWAGFPSQAIRYCLKEAGIGINDVKYIALNRDPGANLMRKAAFTLYKRPSIELITQRLRNAFKIGGIKDVLAREFPGQKINTPVYNIEHHVAHLASSFFVSPFDKAAVVSVDGFGDFVGAMWGIAEGTKIEVKHRTYFPHSLGLFYLALTQHLGFPKYGDEYKVMGMAAYGKPTHTDEMGEIVKNYLDGGHLFILNLDYFNHHKGFAMTWESGEPVISPVFSEKIEALLGPSRRPDEEVNQRHMNIAASIQKAYEDSFFNILNLVYEKTKCPNLVLSGGCVMNSLANGKIFINTPFRDVYIQPAAGDAGGAIGAAFYVYNQLFGKPRSFVLESSYLGPSYNSHDIKNVIDKNMCELVKEGCHIEEIDNEGVLCSAAAQSMSEGKVVGWFQGRMEWGPRALGNRSIICDPRRADMKDILNSKIKRREPFRPFAPSIHLEATGEYFETDYPDPFMLKVYKIKPEKRSIIPAVTHVDGTGRLQTVRKKDNPLYWKLIEEFRKLTGVPVVLNTSFNENEPIVCRPEEALDCFLRTKMDVLVMGNFLIRRN